MEQPRYMSPCEIRLALMWKNEDGESVEEIGRRLRRHVSTLWRLLQAPEIERGVGRKPALTEQDKDRLVALTERMVERAGCCYQVTIEMIQLSFHIDVCDRVISDALHERGMWFCRMREKPVLTPDDVIERFDWAKNIVIIQPNGGVAMSSSTSTIMRLRCQSQKLPDALWQRGECVDVSA